jgi:hypothetical protein
MRRDWPLAASGLGIAAISGTIVACVLLGYELAPGTVPRHCDPPEPPAVLIDGCGRSRSGFADWIAQPLALAAFAVALVLLVIAAVTIRRGLARSGPPGPR